MSYYGRELERLKAKEAAYWKNSINKAEAERDELKSKNEKLKADLSLLQTQFEHAHSTSFYQKNEIGTLEAENEKLKWRVAFSKDMLDDWDIACEVCQLKVAHKFRDRIIAEENKTQEEGDG